MFHQPMFTMTRPKIQTIKKTVIISRRTIQLIIYCHQTERYAKEELLGDLLKGRSTDDEKEELMETGKSFLTINPYIHIQLS